MEKAMPSPCRESLLWLNDGQSPVSISFMVHSHEDWPKLNGMVDSRVEVIVVALFGGCGKLDRVNTKKAMPSPCKSFLIKWQPISCIHFLLGSFSRMRLTETQPQIMDSSVEVIEAALSGGFCRLG
jgi:hypothetical protein